MNTLSTLFGGRSKAEKKAEQEAADAQTRAARASEEQAALAAANDSASARIARAVGKRALAFSAFTPATATAGGPGTAATFGG